MRVSERVRVRVYVLVLVLACVCVGGCVYVHLGGCVYVRFAVDLRAEIPRVGFVCESVLEQPYWCAIVRAWQ